MYITHVDEKTAAVVIIGSLHLGLSALLISNLVRTPPGGFAVGMGLVLLISVSGAIALLFVAWARITGSSATAGYALRLTQIFVCLAVATVLVSWTHVPGFATTSVVYLMVSLVALILASRTARDFRNRS